jgi:hypothetical protein
MANVVALMALLKALEISGSVKRDVFVQTLEVSIRALSERNNHEIASLVGDILDRIRTPESH